MRVQFVARAFGSEVFNERGIITRADFYVAPLAQVKTRARERTSERASRRVIRINHAISSLLSVYLSVCLFVLGLAGAKKQGLRRKAGADALGDLL